MGDAGAAIRLYCGVAETAWNYHPVAPGGYACVSPVKGKEARTHTHNRVWIPPGTKVIQDSGAFSDNWNTRLSFEAALTRQRQHAARYGYADMITHRATYDLLIDEIWMDNGTRKKERWTEGAAWAAVETTVAAAQFMHETRDGYGLVISAQGVTPAQYLDCTRRLLPYMTDGDLFGLGGWCIIGKRPAQMLPPFRETVRLVIPELANAGVKHVHIWGVIYPPALGYLLRWCDDYGLTLSTDSAGAQLKPAFGDWGYGEWRNNSYQRAPVETRGLERARHCQLTRDWLADYRSTVWYQRKPEQLRML